MTRRLIVISSVGIITLFFTYFMFGIPPWVYTLKPSTGTAEAYRVNLFALEFGVLFLVTIYCFIFNQISPTHSKENYKVLVQTIVIVIAIMYAVYKIFHEKPGTGLSGRMPLAGVRLSYGIFSSVVLYLYVDDIAKLVRKTLIPMWELFHLLNKTPKLVFTSGQKLPLSINAFTIRALFLTIPLFLWLPTLLSVTWLSPRNLAIAFAGVTFLLIFIISFYSQLTIAAATQSGLAVIDNLISKEISDSEKLSLRRDSVKTLIQIRSALKTCVPSPMQMLFSPILQSLAGIAALIFTLTQLGS